MVPADDAGAQRSDRCGQHPDKGPAFSDVLYVEQLIAPDVVITMPQATMLAFADHGNIARRLEANAREGEQTLARAADAASTLPPSAPSSNPKACAPSATPITGCSPASRRSSKNTRGRDDPSR